MRRQTPPLRGAQPRIDATDQNIIPDPAAEPSVISERIKLDAIRSARQDRLERLNLLPRYGMSHEGHLRICRFVGMVDRHIKLNREAA